jgi:DnaJ-class molecular chaperone
MKALYYHVLSLMIIVLLMSSANAAANRDFYKILGIKRSAKEKEIKKAFKRMSLKVHPDKNPDDEEALRKYQDVSAAYEVLGDADKRRKYDQCGEKCVDEAGGGGGGFDPFGDMFGFGR